MKTNREEILQNALQLFMSKNYEGVSLQMIAHSVGLTKTAQKLVPQTAVPEESPRHPLP